MRNKWTHALLVFVMAAIIVVIGVLLYQNWYVPGVLSEGDILAMGVQAVEMELSPAEMDAVASRVATMRSTISLARFMLALAVLTVLSLIFWGLSVALDAALAQMNQPYTVEYEVVHQP